MKDLEEAPLNESEDMFSNLIIKLIEDPDFRKKYMNGREMFKKFDEEKIMKSWEHILTK